MFYPPGFPPIPGHQSTGAAHGFVAALVAADKLTAADAGEAADEQNDEEEEEEEEVPAGHVWENTRISVGSK